MERQRHEPESFADLVRKARSTPKDERPVPQPGPRPISDGHWTDARGIRWHIRGDGAGLARPVLRRLLRRPDLRVLHSYGLNPTEVSGDEREALLARVERYLADGAPRYSEFGLAEFRDDDGQVMLVIEESC